MKYLRLALLVIAPAIAIAVARAQDDDRQQRPPTEIPDFSNLDEYIYEPRSTVRLSFRHLSGAKTQFSGTGSIPAPVDPDTGLGGHYYHDGAVRADTRTTPRLDASGNPMIDPQNGATINDPIAPDGKTNTWSMVDQRQVDNAPLGYVAFHTYSAEVSDIGTQHASSRTTNGLDLSVSRDMGKLWKDRIQWNLMAGMSVNDISARRIANTNADIYTSTYLHSLFGQNAPTAPYTAPSSTSSQTVTDSQGNVTSIGVDNTVLISSDPVNTNTAPVKTTSATAVLNNWRVRGAYYTFRAGPEFWYQITSKLRLGVSFGPALIYSSTTYTVAQTLTPDIGDDITVADDTTANKLRPGYYADATVEYDLTDKAGFFAGGVFQSASSYTQSLDTATSKYATKVDLSNQNGFRAGMSIRF